MTTRFDLPIALVVAALTAQAPDPQAIQRMAASERAFAAATAEIGVRDGFLAFFAEDSVQVRAGAPGAAPTIVPAREALAAQPLPRLPILTRLMWEPFTGHVSGDGSMGWLTGGYANLDTVTKIIRDQGAYFSVWKRQANGTWRVWLDEGVRLPAVWRDAAPFRAAPEPDAGTVGTAGDTVQDAEAAVSSGGEPWRARLAEHVRLHRQGRMPFAGRDAAAGFAAETWSSVKYAVVRTEIAGSGDLAVTIGGYVATLVAPGGSAASDEGTWIRVWKRDVSGRWRIVFETSKAARDR